MLVVGLEQQSIDKKEGSWVKAEYPRDDSFFKLEVGEQFIGLYVATKKNPNFENEVIHVFEDNEGVVRQMNGVTNLDRWMSGIEGGTRVKIVRIEDLKVGKPKSLHRFEVYLWKEASK